MKLLTSSRQNSFRSSNTPTERRLSLAARNIAISSGGLRAICGDSRHHPARCPVFGFLSIEERAIQVRRKGLCIRCLEQGHRKASCPSNAVCQEGGCTSAHHRWLHGAPRVALPSRSTTKTTEQVNPVPGVNIGTAAIRNYQQDIVCAVAPVQLRCNGRVVDSFALLDSGSEVTLMDSSVAERLQATGSKRQLRIRTVNGEQVVQVREQTCELSSRDGMFNFCLDRAVAVPRLDVGARVLHLPAVKAEW
uniref:CCHC-type domain-containing protein n=1 Tax=Trichuris muris TaxID=70415 RepID=A0A5S6Q4M0_TRIMR